MKLAPLVERATSHGVEDAVIVYCKEQIITICLEHKYAYLSTWQAKLVGVHPCNRNGEGLLWPRAHSRIFKIRTVGWSWTTSEASAVNIEDHPTNKHIAKYTVKICSQSDKFARRNADEIKIGEPRRWALQSWDCMCPRRRPVRPSQDQRGRENVVQQDRLGSRV